MSFFLQSFNRLQYLFDLIRLCHAFVVLNVDTRVALPRSFVNSVTAPILARFSKIVFANFREILKADSFWVPFHINNNVCDFRHMGMIPLLILFVKGRRIGRNLSTTCDSISKGENKKRMCFIIANNEKTNS